MNLNIFPLIEISQSKPSTFKKMTTWNEKDLQLKEVGFIIDNVEFKRKPSECDEKKTNQRSYIFERDKTSTTDKNLPSKITLQIKYEFEGNEPSRKRKIHPTEEAREVQIWASEGNEASEGNVEAQSHTVQKKRPPKPIPKRKPRKRITSPPIVDTEPEQEPESEIERESVHELSPIEIETLRIETITEIKKRVKKTREMTQFDVSGCDNCMISFKQNPSTSSFTSLVQSFQDLTTKFTDIQNYQKCLRDFLFALVDDTISDEKQKDIYYRELWKIRDTIEGLINMDYDGPSGKKTVMRYVGYGQFMMWLNTSKSGTISAMSRFFCGDQVIKEKLWSSIQELELTMYEVDKYRFPTQIQDSPNLRSTQSK